MARKMTDDERQAKIAAWKQARCTTAHADLAKRAYAALVKLGLQRKVKVLFCIYEQHTPIDVIVLRWRLNPKVPMPKVTKKGLIRHEFVASEVHQARIDAAFQAEREARVQGFAKLAKIFGKLKRAAHEVMDEELLLWVRRG